MRTSLVVCAILASLIVSSLTCLCSAVDTRGIDRVRDKNVLTEEDFITIEQFIRDAIDELVHTTDFTQVARLRAIIVTRQSEQAQYSEQYSKYLRKYIGEAFAQTADIDDPTLRNRVRTNLIILVSELENPRLVDIAFGALDDKDKPVRYWAVRALTNRKLMEKIQTTGGNSSVVDKITSKFEGMVGSAAPEVLSNIVSFCGEVKSEQTDRLLLNIADVRIKEYADWTVQAGPVDIKILKLLCGKLPAGDSEAPEYGRRFAQLYSYIMQKYIMALKDGGLVSEEQKQHLASVLVEIEEKCIGRLTGFEQTVIKRAVELDDANVLQMEQNRLLGDETRPGEIPTKYNFDYGEAADGSRLSEPKKLPEPSGSTQD